MTTAHITIAGRPWCGWTGCQAGQSIVAKVRKEGFSDAMTCGHRSLRSAKAAAKALRPHFTIGSVAVASGPCPDLGV